jgi:hypothetical protein
MLQRLIDSAERTLLCSSLYRALSAKSFSLYFCYVDNEPVGVVVCKIDDHRGTQRGYLGMLVVQKNVSLSIGTLCSPKSRYVPRSVACQHGSV